MKETTIMPSDFEDAETERAHSQKEGWCPPPRESGVVAAEPSARMRAEADLAALRDAWEDARTPGFPFGTEPPPAPRADRESFGSFLGGSAAIKRLYPICERLAAADVPLVIEGETGTGKEALAEEIHRRGRRAKRPFVVFDCTAVPPSLLEGALFGHERGAYTGADSSRAGIFEEADGGTLLIDEIGDLDLGLQSRLLRAIQSQEVRRIGGNRWIRVDVRVIAATRRDLDEEVARGRFRDDLFFRLAVGRVCLPPLRKRPDDVERLARHFWAVHAGPGAAFPEPVLPRLRAYSWPGNVRELANTMARLVAYGEMAFDEEEGLFMRRSTMPAAPRSDSDDFIDGVVARGLKLATARELVLAEFEKRYVAWLDGVHATERARASASGVSDRHLRTLRSRARGIDAETSNSDE